MTGSEPKHIKPNEVGMDREGRVGVCRWRALNSTPSASMFARSERGFAAPEAALGLGAVLAGRHRRRHRGPSVVLFADLPG